MNMNNYAYNMINKENSKTYKWGDNCDSWVMVDHPNLSVKMESMPSGTKEKMHFHAMAQQFFFILKGRATFYLDDKIESVSKNQGILIDPKTVHYIANESGKELDFLVISQPSTTDDRTTVT
ncbi:cupin domain-containing protein [Maribacter polysaccharolyticus]|uniref:cupin domain-containing protein n=1 Tax=Maribacter polysaccharolyticus TaxID=3020831 RepID=UPI00237F197A|nr:cupin domain-containing protein [Maribacter polysaccharolyticus]MDE3743864.1 cupin domain-containing protein [Maribacter polysaccharolyticus]